jgi:4-amino-4-deoxy-L-arabinose transferase-like glycosyltransferase
LIGIPKSQPSTYPQKPSGWIDVILLLAAFLLLTFDIGRYGLFEPHEGHFAGIAREMVLRGDWVTPTLNGAPYLNKPPLLYWLIATSYKAFGIHEAAARLPIALAGWTSVLIAWHWSRQLWGKLASRATVIFLSVSVGWFIFGHQLLIDELLGMLLLSMMYCLWRLLQDPKSHLFFVAAYLFLGLAVLAKGVLALAFWMAACGAITLTHRRWKSLFLFRPFLGLGVSAALVLPWFIAVERANPGFVQYFLFNENLKRALDTRWPPDYSISKVSPWAYLVVVLLWCLPWTLLLPPALLEIWHRWRQNASAQASPEERNHQNALTLLVVLAALPILLFLPLSSRLYYYSIPSLPPLAMMAGHWWAIASNGKSERARRWLGWSMAGLGTAIATSLVWLPQSVVGFFPELAQTNGVQTLITVILVGLSVGFIGTGLSLLRGRMDIALVLLWFGFGTSWACVIQGFKTIQDFRSSKTLVQTASQRLGSETLWIFEGSRELGAAGAMSFYLDPDGINIPPYIVTKLPLFISPTSRDSKPSIPGKISTSRDSLLLIKEQNGRSTAIPTINGALSAEWEFSPLGKSYATVLVLTDGGSNRLPPEFPGAKPQTLISKAQMQQYWMGDRPVVFVTDFLRMPKDPQDPPTLNLPRDSSQPLLEIGPRKLYGNGIARKLWLK